MRRTHLQVLQARCDEFNAKWPLGTLVHYYPVLGHPVFREGHTRSVAQILSGHTPVIWLDSERGCVCLVNCKPQRPATPGQGEKEKGQ